MYNQLVGQQIAETDVIFRLLFDSGGKKVLNQTEKCKFPVKKVRCDGNRITFYGLTKRKAILGTAEYFGINIHEGVDFSVATMGLILVKIEKSKVSKLLQFNFDPGGTCVINVTRNCNIVIVFHLMVSAFGFGGDCPALRRGKRRTDVWLFRISNSQRSKQKFS